MSSRLRYLVSSFLVGVLSLGIAWAGSVITPPRPGAPGIRTQHVQAGAKVVAQLEEAAATGELGPGQVWAGAAKTSIEPRPDDWGGVWAKEGCATLGDDFADSFDHIFDTRVKWLENSNCIYSGGFGIGPMNPLTEWDQEYGLWVRSAAISDGTDTLVLTILDGAYYFGHNRDMCSPNQACGFFDLADTLGAELGLDPSSFMFASTHAHSSPDFIGAWGGVPRFYMNQVTDALMASVKAAVANMAPARIEVGEELARQFGNERRDFYRSAEEHGLSWIRLVGTGATPDAPIAYSCTIDCPAAGEPEPGSAGAAATSERKGRPVPVGTPSQDPECERADGRPNHCPTPEPTPTETPSPDPTPPGERAITTIGAYAAHPTNKGAGPLAHADFAAPFEARVENLWGGVGLFFQTGLGNISSSSGGHPEGDEKVEQMGFGLASLMPSLSEGRFLTNGDEPLDLTIAQRFWNQPVTNTVLAAGGVGGIFDRRFEQAPGSVQASEEADPRLGSVKDCRSASPLSVRTAVSAARIGDLLITGAPGEIFSNLSNTIKEKSPGGVTLPLALVNDGLGYIMQSFETDHAGRQGLGFVGEVVEYEDAFSIDHCFGDMTLEATLLLIGQGGIANALP